MSSFVGERLLDNATPRYMLHPPAASAWITDGRPIDAGTAHIIDNNISHLSSESVRHLAWDVGPGTLNYQGHGFGGLSDAVDPGASVFTGAGGADLISWDRRTARKYGPFPMILDSELTLIAGATIRSLNAYVDCSVGALNSLNLLMAVTANAQAPTSSSVTSTSTLASVLPGTGRRRQKLSIAPLGRVTGGDLWRSRGSGIYGSVQTVVVPFWVWIGWYSSSGSDAIIGMSLWETR